MARIAGINIPMNKHVGIGLTHIYGIGRTRAKIACEVGGRRPDDQGEGSHRAEVDRAARPDRQVGWSRATCAAKSR